MGGAVSSGEDNSALVDNLVEAEYIKSKGVEQVFRMVDRGFYYTKLYRSSAYKDMVLYVPKYSKENPNLCPFLSRKIEDKVRFFFMAWKDGNLHLSAPCIYSKVMENLHLKRGHAFLNIGSGTGYLSSMVGCMIGKTGVNHGIELHSDVVEYSRTKLESFLKCSPAVDVFEFCAPQFVVGNCMDINGSYNHRYDRIYCGAACPENYLQIIIDLLKIGGLCIVPVNDSLVQITRITESRVEMKNLLPVSFASLYMEPNPIPQPKEPVQLPDLNPSSLAEICREQIRSILRQSLKPPDLKSNDQDSRKRSNNRRARRRRRNRLLVVQRRRNTGSSDGDINGRNGYISITYSARRGHTTTTTSDDDDARNERRANNSRQTQSPTQREREDRRQSFTKSKETKTKSGKSSKSNETTTKMKKESSTKGVTTRSSKNGTNVSKAGENGKIEKNQSDDSMEAKPGSSTSTGTRTGPRKFEENLDFSDNDDDDDDDGNSGQNVCDLPLTKEDFEKLPKNRGHCGGRNRTRNTVTIMRSSHPFPPSTRDRNRARLGSSSSIQTTTQSVQSSQSQSSSTRAERGSTSGESLPDNSHLGMGAASMLSRIRNFVAQRHAEIVQNQQRAAAENYAERLAEVDSDSDSSMEEDLPDLEELPDEAFQNDKNENETPTTSSSKNEKKNEKKDEKKNEKKDEKKKNESSKPQRKIITVRPLPPKVYQLSSSPSSTSSDSDNDDNDNEGEGKLKNDQKMKSPSKAKSKPNVKETFTFDSDSSTSSVSSLGSDSTIHSDDDNDDDFELPDIDDEPPNSQDQNQMRCPMGHRLRLRNENEDPMEEGEVKPIPDEEMNHAAEDTPITNSFSLELMEKIQLLPLPPALKIYVNYNRKLN